MEPEIEPMDYPANGTVDDLTNTTRGDEDGLRGKLVRLQRVHNNAGEKAIRATYQIVPDDKPYVSKDLFFFDITDASADEIKEITEDQLEQGNAFAFPGADSANVYLNDKEAIVAVYRAK